MNTLLLDNTHWDLLLDTSGNIAMASEPYSFAQDVASAVKLFKSELFYDGTKGVPYFGSVLGHSPSVPLLKAYFVKAALTVPGVISATCFITSMSGRAVTGQIQFTDENKVVGNVSIV